jgi:hypothetical protein
MDDALDRVLRLVAEGRLSADEAAPILDALASRGKDDSATKRTARAVGSEADPATPDDTGRDRPRFARIEVRESGRRVVDLRVPISVGRLALGRIPGISGEQVAEVEQAVVSGARGPILDIEDADGDGVRIVLE